MSVLWLTLVSPCTSQELYFIFVEEMERLYRGGACGEKYFYEVWHKHRPNVRPRVGGDFMKCNPCTHFHDTLNGSPGLRATVDPAVRARAEVDRARHLQVIT